VAIREPEQKGERRFTVRFESNPHLVIGWHKPSFPDRADYACDVIENLLSDGKTSRLYSSLVLEKKIASSISAWNGFPGARYDSLFLISGTPRPPHTAADLENAVYAEIDRLKRDLSGEELRKVQNRIESSLVFNLASNMGVAGYLSYYESVMGDWGYLASYLEEIKKVSEADITSALDRYFTVHNRTVGILEDTRRTR